jgi:hypothetical protein
MESGRPLRAEIQGSRTVTVSAAHADERTKRDENFGLLDVEDARKKLQWMKG